MSPKRLKYGMKPSLYPVQISKILPKPLPRLFLDPSYGPGLNYRLLMTRSVTGIEDLFTPRPSQDSEDAKRSTILRLK